MVSQRQRKRNIIWHPSYYVKLLSRVWFSATPWTVAHQDPPSMGFSRQEYWSGLPFPSPGDLPGLGTEPRSPTLQADTVPSEPPGKPQEKELKWSEVKSLSHVRLCDPVDCSPPSSSVHGILQARTLEWVAVSFSRGSSWPRDRTQVSHIAGRRFTLWATKEAQYGIPHMWNLNRKDTREHQTQT